jgi:NAD(P)-dependent dehydrogenase (short-subunit alcohol dehydrogenase family)
VRHLDLADLPDAADVINELADALGGGVVLVNNAGTSRQGGMLELSYPTTGGTRSPSTSTVRSCARSMPHVQCGAGRGAL